MKIWIIPLLIWFTCGTISSGFYSAYRYRGVKNPAIYQDVIRDECAMLIGQSLVFGIPGLILSPFLTGFFMYGWLSPCPQSSLGYR
jgi:hypothetical protein